MKPSIVPPLVVTGMPRSGTSATARVLASAGLHVGDRLNPPREDNKLGYYEDVDFYELHRRMIAAALPNAARRRPNWMHAGGIEPERLEAFRGEAEALLRERGSHGRAWGFKETRAAALLPFWKSAAPGAVYLFVYRSPWEVVDSLMRLEGRPLAGRAQQAIETWIAYNRGLLGFARANRRRCAFVHPAALATAGDTVVEVANRLLAVAGAPALATVDRGAFVPALLHGIPESDPRAEIVRAAFPEAAELYEALERRADVSSRESSRLSADAVLRTPGSGVVPLRLVSVGRTSRPGQALESLSVTLGPAAAAANTAVAAADDGLVAVLFDAAAKPAAFRLAAAALASDDSLGAVLLVRGAGKPAVAEIDEELFLRAGEECAGIVLERSTWERCGGFDVSLPLAGLDAWALAAAILASGRRVIRVLDAVAERAEAGGDANERRLALRLVFERDAALFAAMLSRARPPASMSSAKLEDELRIQTEAAADRLEALEALQVRADRLEAERAELMRTADELRVRVAAFERERDAQAEAAAERLAALEAATREAMAQQARAEYLAAERDGLAQTVAEQERRIAQLEQERDVQAEAATERLAALEVAKAKMEIERERVQEVERLARERELQAEVADERLAALEAAAAEQARLRELQAELEAERDTLARVAEERLESIEALERERNLQARIAEERLERVNELTRESELRMVALAELNALREEQSRR